MTLLKKLSTSWNIVGQRCQQLVFQPYKMARSKRWCFLFCHPLLTVCLLPTFPKRKLLLSASLLIRDKMVILDSAVAGESSIQGFWIYTCMFPVHFLKQKWRLQLFLSLKLRVNSQFLGRGRCRVKQLDFSLKTHSPIIHYFAWNCIVFSEKLIAVKFSQNCNYIFDQWEKNWWVWRQDLRRMSTNFDSGCGVVRPASPMLQNQGWGGIFGVL